MRLSRVDAYAPPVVDGLDRWGVPGPLPTLLEPLVAVGTLQLYGLLIRFAACLLYKYRQGVGIADAWEAGRTIRADLENAPDVLRQILDA